MISFKISCWIAARHDTVIDSFAFSANHRDDFSLCCEAVARNIPRMAVSEKDRTLTYMDMLQHDDALSRFSQNKLQQAFYDVSQVWYFAGRANHSMTENATASRQMYMGYVHKFNLQIYTICTCTGYTNFYNHSSSNNTSQQLVRAASMNATLTKPETHLESCRKK